jgi:beta-lactamase regulating signal transducer with metallopeptidase domain
MSIVEFLSQPLWQRLGMTLVHFLWQGLAVAVLVGAFVKVFRLKHGNARYAAYLLAFIAMIVCPVVTFTAIDIPISPNNELVTGAESAEVVDSSPYTALPVGDILPEAETPRPAIPTLADSIPLSQRISGWLNVSMPWILVIWMAGVVVLSVRLLTGFVGVYRWRHHLEPLPERLAQRIVSLSEVLGMRRFSGVFISPTVLQAMAVGYLRPMVLLPAAMVTQMQPEMLEAVIAHELAHIRRFDLWVNLAQRVTETLLFYHPAVWWLSICLRSERELCCDELAVKATGRRLTYASTLESIGRARFMAKQPILAAGLGRYNKPTLNRVRHILGLDNKLKDSRFWLAGVIAVLLIMALVIPTGFALTARSKDKSDVQGKSQHIDVETLLNKVRQAQRPTENMIVEWQYENPQPVFAVAPRSRKPDFSPPSRILKTYKAIIAGDKSRIEERELTFQSQKDTEPSRIREITYVFDGTMQKQLDHSVKGFENEYRGSRYTYDKNTQLLLKLLLAYPPFLDGPKLLEKYNLKVIENKEKGLIILETSKEDSGIHRFTIDPDKDYNIVKQDVILPRGKDYEINCIVKKQANGLWYQVAREQIRYSAKTGKSFLESKVKITKLDFNPEIPTGAFELQFPKGIKIWDVSLKDWIIVGEEETSREPAVQVKIQEKKNQKELSKFKKTLAIGVPVNGVTVELMGVCDHPSEGKQWWRPDGSLLKNSPYDDDFGRAFPKDGEKGYKFAVKYSGIAGRDIDTRVIPLNFKTTNGGALFSTSKKNGKENMKYLDGALDEKIVWLGAAFDEELLNCDIKIGVCLGDWKRNYRYETEQSNDAVEWVTFKNVSLKPNFKTLANGVTIEQPATIRVPEDYPTEYAAVKAAKAGDTIVISGDRYRGEDILIEPKLEIEVEKTASNNSGGDSKRHQLVTFREGMSIREALRFLGKAHKKNIILSYKVAGQVPVNELYNVTFEETLQAILGTHKYIIDGDFIRVYTEEEFESIYPEEKTNSQVEVEKPAVQVDEEASTLKLKRLGTVLLAYAKEHDGEFPSSYPVVLPRIKRELGESDFSWYVRHITYIGKHKRVSEDRSRIIAYNKIMLKQGEGTDVLFPNGDVGFIEAPDLKSFGLKVPGVKEESAEKLMQLGIALLIYARDHEGVLPSEFELDPIRQEMSDSDFRWCLGHAEYIGQGKKPSFSSWNDRTIEIAYDKTLLRQGEGTNVLFMDCRVEFLGLDRLEELGIPAFQVEGESGHYFEQRFELGKDIPVQLEVGKLENRILVSAKTIRFEKNGNEVGVELTADVRNGLGMEWQTKVELLSVNNKVLDVRTVTTGTHGLSDPPVMSVRKLEFLPFEWDTIADAVSFRVSFEQLSPIRDAMGREPALAPKELIQGRITDAKGQPVADAVVTITEYNPRDKVIRVPKISTNLDGYYKLGKVNWPYYIVAQRLLPTTFGQPELHHSIRLKKVFEGAQTVDLQFDEFPKGSGSFECRVVDKNGKAVERFHFMVIDDIDWEAIDYKGPAGGYLRTKVYRMDVDNTEGRFTVEDLPAGSYKVWIIPKDGRYQDKRYEDTKEKILVEEGAHVKKIIEVPSKYVLYGRVLFEDGSPAVVEPTPWPGAKSSIFVPMGSRGRGIADIDDDGYFAVHLSAREHENLKSGKDQLMVNIPTSQEGRRRTVGKFPFEILSEDRDKAGVIRVKRPEKQKLTKPAVPVEAGKEALTAEKLVLKLVDNSGRPVAGAKMGTSVRTRDEQVLNSKLYWSLSSKEKDVSDEDGKIVLTQDKLFPQSWNPDRRRALYILNEERQIGAFCEISKDNERNQIELTLEPVCHVHGKLSSEDLEEIGRPLKWSNVYLSFNKDSHGVLSCMSEKQQFDFWVPPGEYTLSAYGSGDGESTKHVRPIIEVKTGQSELDLGVVDLPATKLSTLIGKSALEIGPIRAWKNGSPVKLSELRGKPVILHFGGGYPSTSRDLPRLVELHEDFHDAGRKASAGCGLPTQVRTAAVRIGLLSPKPRSILFRNWAPSNRFLGILIVETSELLGFIITGSLWIRQATRLNQFLTKHL